MTKKLLLTSFFAVVALTGCDQLRVAQPEVFDNGDEAFFDRPNSAQDSDMSRSEDVRRDNFNVKFKKIADKRRPKALANSVEQNVIHEYDPDKLQGGVRSLFQNHMDNYFGVNSRGEEELIAEMDVRDFKTQIVDGTFLSGRQGNYRVYIEADVRVRDGLGKVYVIDTYKVDYKTPRRSNDGYPPSERLDKSRMLDAVAAAMRNLGDDLSHDVRVKLRAAHTVR
ncbi:MAG: hypothetical protein GC134_00305 [Proteobacteria bacterium]|nr:hypothetical protein [Pseudomonadota bacterium]